MFMGVIYPGIYYTSCRIMDPTPFIDSCRSLIPVARSCKGGLKNMLQQHVAAGLLSGRKLGRGHARK